MSRQSKIQKLRRLFGLTKPSDDFVAQVRKLRRKRDMKEVSSKVDAVRKYVDNAIATSSAEYETTLEHLRELIRGGAHSSDSQIAQINESLTRLLKERDDLVKFERDALSAIREEIQPLNDLQRRLDEFAEQIEDLRTKQEDTSSIDAMFEKLRRDFNARFANMGGGNANRNILVGGNASTMAKYADLDIQASSNITLATTNDDTSRTTRLVISASGGTITVSSFATIAGAQSVILGSVPATVLGVDVNGQVLSVPAGDYDVSGSVLNLLNPNTPASVYGKIVYS